MFEAVYDNDPEFVKTFGFNELHSRTPCGCSFDINEASFVCYVLIYDTAIIVYIYTDIYIYIYNIYIYIYIVYKSHFTHV
jgi:hypothetical protein